MQDILPAEHEASTGPELLLIMAKHVEERKSLYWFVFLVYW